jgi:hypothetical protein
MEKVIYIGYQPISKKFYSDFYIDKCIASGFEVEYWDISNLYFPDLKLENSFYFANSKYINSFRELKVLLSIAKLKSTIFIIHITFNFKVWRLFSILSLYNCTLVFFANGMHPSPDRSLSLKIKEIILLFDYKRLIRGLEAKIGSLPKNLKIFKSYDYIFKAGTEGCKSIGVGYHIDINKGRVIDINSPDYDKFLATFEDSPIIDEPYCVFLDQYLPYHPDFPICGIKTVGANDYYKHLNKFFEFIENKFKIKVIIAAHPKAIKYKSENPFDSRLIVFDKTCELVRDSKFVLTHHSNSISFPILFKKPILFITSQAEKETMYLFYELVIYYGKFLNCQVIHFDNINKKEDINLFVDIDRYENYKYKYLTSKESEDRNSSEIFIETILNL